MSVWDALTTRQITRIIVTGAVVVGGLWLLQEIRGTLLLLGIALFLAVALGPAVDVIETRGRLPRGAAILAVYLLILGVFAGVIALVVPPVIDGASGLANDIPGYVDDLRENKTFKEFDDDYDITPKLEEEAEKLPNEIGNAAGTLQDIATGIVNVAFQLITILTMTFFLLLDGKRMVAFAQRRLGPARGPRAFAIADRIYRSTAGYVAGALSIATFNGIFTYVVLKLLGVPFAVPLAVLMSFFGLIPLIGATIGGVIILLVTVFTDFPNATIIYAIVLVVYQQFENNMLQPWVYKRTVNVPPLAVIVAILAGSALLGIVGALVAIPIAAATQIILREFLGETPDDEPPVSLEKGDGGPVDLGRAGAT